MGLTAHQRKQKEAEILERRATVMQNILSGMAYSEIAAKLDVSKTLIAKDFAAVKASMMERLGEDMMEHVAMQNAQLDRALRVHWPRMLGAVQGERNVTEAEKVRISNEATDRILRILERKARLLGLNAQTYLRESDDDYDSLLAEAYRSPAKGKAARPEGDTPEAESV